MSDKTKRELVKTVLSIIQGTLLALKFGNIITLSWLWILCPIWLPLSLGLLLLIIYTIMK